MRSLILALALLLAPLSAKAQNYAPLPPGTVAITYCIGGRVTTVMNMDWAETDSLPELIAHEKKHQEQARRYAPGCPPYSDTHTLMLHEIEAYCASRPYRMKLGFTKDQADGDYLLRIVAQFKGEIPSETIIQSYFKGCP